MTMYRIEAVVHYAIAENKIVSPYWAAGIGGSWNDEFETYPGISLETSRHPNGFFSPVIRGYIGSELNIFDFIYADVNVGYEMVGPYLFAENKKYFPYLENVIFGFSLGTYVF
jgi:hypothetical protein